MGDWLLKAAGRLNLKEASLNVMDATFYPKELNLHPLTVNAKTLKTIIDKVTTMKRYLFYWMKF